MTYYHTAKQIQLNLQIIRQCFSWSPRSPYVGGGGGKNDQGWIECETRTDCAKRPKIEDDT